LETLSVDGVPVLRQYSYGRKTHWFYPSDGTVRHLVNEGILYCSSDLPDAAGRCAFTITSDAEPYLRKSKKV
jgi:hypothetical protein